MPINPDWLVGIMVSWLKPINRLWSDGEPYFNCWAPAPALPSSAHWKAWPTMRPARAGERPLPSSTALQDR